MHMHELLTGILDILFPPRKEERSVRTLTPAVVQSLYLPQRHAGWHALAAFSTPAIRALIHEAKYHNNPQAHGLLAELVKLFLEHEPSRAHARWVPIPLSPTRERARGYNQVHAVLAAPPLRGSILLTPHLLVRTRDTRSQTELKRAERLSNMHEAFLCPHPELVQGTDIIIVDDVVTTGATLRAAAAALSAAHPRSITLLALAH